MASEGIAYHGALAEDSAPNTAAIRSMTGPQLHGHTIDLSTADRLTAQYRSEEQFRRRPTTLYALAWISKVES